MVPAWLRLENQVLIILGVGEDDFYGVGRRVRVEGDPNFLRGDDLDIEDLADRPLERLGAHAVFGRLEEVASVLEPILLEFRVVDEALEVEGLGVSDDELNALLESELHEVAVLHVDLFSVGDELDQIVLGEADEVRALLEGSVIVLDDGVVCDEEVHLLGVY